MLKKVLISKRREERLTNSFTNRLATYFPLVLGKLLTTLDAVIENDHKLKALKDRVKDMQKEAWEGINISIFDAIEMDFQVKESPEDPKKIEEGVRSFYGGIEESVLVEFRLFLGVLQNLIGAVMENEYRRNCMNKEIKRIVNDYSVKIRRGLLINVAETFEMKISTIQGLDKMSPVVQ